jgi:flagellar motor switch protein FliN/FliY
MSEEDSVEDLSEEELAKITEDEAKDGTSGEGDVSDQAGETSDEEMAVDDDMLADMLDQASDAPEDEMAVDDDMLADMLDQASDAPEGEMSVDDDMLADMLDQASDEDTGPALDSEGNPMDDEMAALWGDALGEQASGEEEFVKGSVVNSDNVDYQTSMPPALNQEYGGSLDLDIIMDVPITISMEVGRTLAPIRNLLQLNQGSVIELDRLAGESLDVMVNGCLIAHGEVVVVNEKFGIRLTDIISVDERVKKISL